MNIKAFFATTILVSLSYTSAAAHPHPETIATKSGKYTVTGMAEDFDKDLCRQKAKNDAEEKAQEKCPANVGDIIPGKMIPRAKTLFRVKLKQCTVEYTFECSVFEKQEAATAQEDSN